MPDMAALEALTSAYRAERATHRPRPPRTPLLVRVARLAARTIPTWKRFRTGALHIAGFGLLTAAAWTVALPLGLAAAGLSVLVLDFLAGEK